MIHCDQGDNGRFVELFVFLHLLFQSGTLFAMMNSHGDDRYRFFPKDCYILDLGVGAP